MIKVIAIGGEPATGKTTLVREVIKRIGGPAAMVDYKFKTFAAHLVPSRKLIIAGIYSGSGTFGGTDRLSMGVMPAALEFIHKNDALGFEDWRLLFEGDRLFCNKFIEACNEICAVDMAILSANEELTHFRHGDRGDTQNATWLAGRKTKVRNVAAKFPHHTCLVNETAEDLEKNTDWLLQRL